MGKLINNPNYHRSRFHAAVFFGTGVALSAETFGARGLSKVFVHQDLNENLRSKERKAAVSSSTSSRRSSKATESKTRKPVVRRSRRRVDPLWYLDTDDSYDSSMADIMRRISHGEYIHGRAF